MACLVNVEEREIVLTGYVGEVWWDDGFTSAEVIMALAQIGRDQAVTIRLNSGGGYATDGAAIHAALKAHRGRVTVVVEGIAASAASLIAVAGDDVAMALGAVMMIHDTSDITWGTAADHRRAIEMLEVLSNSYAQAYADKTGATAEAMRALMIAETWLTAEEAVAQKFADRLASANANEPTAFAYGAYAHAPEKMVALANSKGWTANSLKRPRARVEPTPSQTPEPPTMTDKTPKTPSDDATAAAVTAGVTAALARIDAITGHAEAEGREALAAHLARKTTMSVDDAVAALQASPKTPGGDPVADFEKRKIEAADDGLGAPTTPKPEAVKAGWKKATDRVNSRVH